MYTRQAGGLLGFLKSNDTYDPDRLAADQQKLRAFYLTQGYADFRVVSALAELTPDRRDFVITYVVEEGPRYKFGKVERESALPRSSRSRRSCNGRRSSRATGSTPRRSRTPSPTSTSRRATSATRSRTSARPTIATPKNRLMNVTIKVGETPRVYVERIDITGNTTTRDKVIRREFRLNEGDAFNALKVKRSQDRIQSLGFFRRKARDQADRRLGTGPRRSRRQCRGKADGPALRFGRLFEPGAVRRPARRSARTISWARASSSMPRSTIRPIRSRSQLGFVDPYFLDKPILVGGQLFRQDYNSFNYVGNDRNTTYKQAQHGRRPAARLPDDRILELRRPLHAEQRQDHARQEPRSTPTRTAPGRCRRCATRSRRAAICATRSARASRRWSAFRRSTTTPTAFARRAGSALTFSPGFRRPRRRREVYPRPAPTRRSIKGFGGGWIFSAHAEGGYHPCAADIARAGSGRRSG